MRIRFELTEEDVLAHQEFYSSHSPAMRKTLARSRWAGTISVWVLSIMVCFALRPNFPALIVALATLGAGFYAWYFPILYRRRVRRLVRKMLAEGENNPLHDEHEIEILEDGILYRKKFSETKYAWGAIERIESTAAHTFIYVGAAHAIVIPRNAISAGSYQELMAEIGRNFQPHQPLQRTALESN